MNVRVPGKPIADFSKSPIVQIGFVVADAARAARNYSRLFGVGPWIYADDLVSRAVFRGSALEEGSAMLRACVANIGRLQIELIQPLGPGTWIDFLKQRGGDGVHHVNFGIVPIYDEALAAWQQHGVKMEMEGVIGGCITACYVDMARQLGMHLELVRPFDPSAQPALGQWGVSAQPSHSLMANRPIRQVGIVVHDAAAMARNYEELLGIGPWMLMDVGARDGDANAQAQPQLATWDQATATALGDSSATWTLRGVSMMRSGMRLKIAVCSWEGMQFKLIQPLEGQNIYWEFLRANGPGVHHLGFGHVDDYDALLKTFSAQGIDTEMTGTVGERGRFAHLATAKELGVAFQIGSLPQGGDLLT